MESWESEKNMFQTFAIEKSQSCILNIWTCEITKKGQNWWTSLSKMEWWGERAQGVQVGAGFTNITISKDSDFMWTSWLCACNIKEPRNKEWTIVRLCLFSATPSRVRVPNPFEMKFCLHSTWRVLAQVHLPEKCSEVAKEDELYIHYEATRWALWCWGSGWFQFDLHVGSLKWW